MTPNQISRLAPYLNALYQQQKCDYLFKDDPIEFPHRFSDARDIEIAGWLASVLAVGKVALFKAVIEKILAVMGHAPYRYLVAFNPARERGKFDGIAYRFYTSEDIFQFICLMHRVVLQYGSIGAFFLSCYREQEPDVRSTLSRFVEQVRKMVTRPLRGVAPNPHLLPSPDQNSACKRWNLYLRWMVRKDDGIDFGLWREIPPSKLIIPLDTHIARIGGYLGLTSRKTADWTMAKEITQSLKEIDPIDPLKYDFALCHLGISGDCPIVKNNKKCFVCKLLPACKRGIAITRKQKLNKSGRIEI
jgi:uncharacterized protein (TIGR02757 family)